MTNLLRLLGFTDEKRDALGTAREVAAHLQSRQPAAGWQAALERPIPKLSIGNRLIVTFADREDGVVARVLEPGQPGDDDPPVILRQGYEVKNFAYHLEGRAQLLGKLTVYSLRQNAVYQVTREFQDFQGNLFPVGMRLTFVNRNFLPYHGGHTITFAEATVYLHEDGEVYKQFEDYFAIAHPQ